MTQLRKNKWKDQRQGFTEALAYMKGRMLGEITSFKTPWPKFNDAATDGLEWNTTTIIAGRPGAGKTLIKDQIIRESFKLNPGLDFRVLEFSLEMSSKSTALREYSSVLHKPYKKLCSADGTSLTEGEIQSCYEYAKERVKYPIDVIEESCTVIEFRDTIIEYMEEYSYMNDTGVKQYKKTVVTLDHSLLLETAAYEDRSEMLYSLGKVLTSLKRKYPIAFIILSQLNRSIDNPERNEDGKYGNYILESDIFGADALLQHADILLGVNKPAKQKIRFYGPDRYIIEDDNVLAFHFLKCRNGEPRLSFFRSQFHIMEIIEMDTPPTQGRLRT